MFSVRFEAPFVAAVAGAGKSGKSSLLKVAARQPAATFIAPDVVEIVRGDVSIRLVEADPEDMTDERPDAIVFMVRGEEYPEVAVAPIARRLRAAVAAGLPVVVVVHWRGPVLPRLDPGRRRLRAALDRVARGWSGPIVDAGHRPGGANKALKALAALARESVPA